MSIDCRELRIGNWVNEINIGFLKVDLIDIENILRGDTNYNPIPLTPEILYKCGFERGEYGGFVKNYFSWSFGVFCMCDGSFLVKCEYLHQLQNIYFVLTGKELEPKL